MGTMKILGVESSCDETAAAVVVNGTQILSSVVSSQVAVHHPFGGVVPELASRKHMEAIVPVVDEALREAGIQKNELDAIAATQGPGLIGALLVGFSFARAYAYALNIPFIGVNHLEGHINSVFLEAPSPVFPFVSLLVSGGHTSIYYVTSHTKMVLMGQTRDDAAGEAYDKVAKMLGLGYPGGLVIDRLSRKGIPGKISFPRSYLDKSKFDFSFSGLKSAVRRYIQIHEMDCKHQEPDIAAEFQEAVVEVLSYKIIRAAMEKDCREIAVVGGVAANSRLREKVFHDAHAKGLKVHIPSVELCGDNAAIIASIGFHHLKENKVSKLNHDVYSRASVPMPGKESSI